MKVNINKFSFSQLTSNNDGKTSGSGTMGVLICTIGTLCFFLGCIDKMFINKDIDVITQAIILVGIGAALLGHRNQVRKGTGDSKIPLETSETCSTCQKDTCECTSMNS